jgi:hypothetical protein
MFLKVNGNEEQIAKLNEYMDENDCGWEWNDNILDLDDDCDELIQKYLSDQNIEYEEAEDKMFRVVIVESQSYEVYVEAPTKEAAESIALDTYGCNGNIFHSDANAIFIEEEEAE